MIYLGLIVISFDYIIFLDMKLENVTRTAPFDQYKSLTEFSTLSNIVWIAEKIPFENQM